MKIWVGWIAYALAQSSSLVSLDLRNISHFDSAVSFYLKLRPLTNVVYLPQKHNDVNNDCAIMLANNKCIKWLRIDGKQNYTYKGLYALAANFGFKILYFDNASLGNFSEVPKPISEFKEEYKNKNWIVEPPDNFTNCMVYCEKNPVERANNARKLGIKTEVPSLRLISLFAYPFKKSTLPLELQSKLDELRTLVDVSNNKTKIKRTMNV